MPKKSAKPKHSGRPSKAPRTEGRGRAVTEAKASTSRSGPGKKNDKSKQEPLREPRPEPVAATILPSPPPAPDTPTTVQQWAHALLEKLAWLSSDYQEIALVDMEAHRKSTHPNLLHTARILQAAVRATDLGDHGWLEEQGKIASVYIARHRPALRPSGENRTVHDVRTRPQALRELKGIVIRKLTASVEDLRWPDGVSSKVSENIASVIVGDLFQDAVLAWEILPGLARDWNEASARSAVAQEIRRILQHVDLQENTRRPKTIDSIAETIVRQMLVVLGYRGIKPKNAFESVRKARARGAAGSSAGREVLEPEAADHAPAEMQATAETSGSVPPSERNA